MHSLHFGYTLALPLKDDAMQDELATLLSQYNSKNGSDGSNLNFEDCSLVIFASASVLPKEKYENENEDEDLPPTFVLATSFCGSYQKHLSEMVAHCKNALHNILKYCSTYNFTSAPDDGSLIKFLRSNRQPLQFFGSRLHLISKKDITNEKLLRKEIESFLDRTFKNNFSGYNGEDIKNQIEQYVISQPYLAWALSPVNTSLQEKVFKKKLKLLGIGLSSTYLGGLLLSKNKLRYLGYSIGALTIITTAVAAAVKHMEKHKTAGVSLPAHNKVRKVMQTQNHPVVNEMTASSPLKPGRVRRAFYSTVLAFLTQWHSVNIPTVSTIRWVLINNRKRLLFLSNFTNTTDFYVRDFLAGDIPYGVNFLFGNGKDFPDTRCLIFGGMAENPEGYMNAIHEHQYATQFWYAHEPNLSIDIILNNRKIRQGLFKKLTEDERTGWLKLF